MNATHQYGVSISMGTHEGGTVPCLVFFCAADRDWKPTELATFFREVFKKVMQEDFQGKTNYKKAMCDLFAMQWHETCCLVWEAFKINGWSNRPHDKLPMKGWFSFQGMETWVSDDPDDVWSFREEARTNGEVSSELFELTLFAV